MSGDESPVVQASHELYRRTRRLRWRLGVGAVLLVPALAVAVGYLARSSPNVAMVVGTLVFGAGFAGHQILTRWLPKHRARKVWFAEIEQAYGVTRAEVLKISLGLEYHDPRRIDGPVSF